MFDEGGSSFLLSDVTKRRLDALMRLDKECIAVYLAVNST